LIGANDGQPVVLAGHVRDPAGQPLAGAQLDIWHTAPNGLYSNQDQDQARYNLRFRMQTDAAGRYAFSTTRPMPYMVPDDGPVGDLLHATGRHPWRPAHFHFIVTAAGMAPLVTELFPADDPYLDQDAVFGVRESLILDLQPEVDRGALPAELEARDRLPLPVLFADYDFTLGVATS
jgi:protocatechuate 3,4-dioxygenase beta subunit